MLLKNTSASPSCGADRSAPAASGKPKRLKPLLTVNNVATSKESLGWVHCWICTHTVRAKVFLAGRKQFVKAGQKCPRCSSALDAAYVVRLDEAA